MADRTDVRLPGLFLGATHTHAGPGQFDASHFYNRFASNRPGFDPAWTQFLADRIAGAVIDAVRARVPARARGGPHRGLGPHPQPLPRSLPTQPDGDRQASGPTAQVRCGEPLAPPGAGRRRGR